MPALDQSIIDDLTLRLKRFLDSTGGYDDLEYLDAGGSAAVFRVRRGKDVRAIKGFDPALFDGKGATAERRRLELQRRLIAHQCPNLVQTYRADEAEGTAFIEMEFIEWPQLAKKIAEIPDSAVASLISQLVNAVRYLESLNIVHRDIKPENIHITSDFKQLKLLDLGVAREFDSPEENDAAVTDHGNRRPFLATAQYSSPEYLFRLDEPTDKLWRGLNIYQVGAVLHDLIKKEPIFQHEMGLGNRWLVARAVLTKQPSFADPDPNRLSALKALAQRCLTKDLETRLVFVGWEDFLLEGSANPLESLRGRLAKGAPSPGNRAREGSKERLDFERAEYFKRISDGIRAELVGICTTQLPLTMRLPAPGEPLEVQILLSANKFISIDCRLVFNWKAGLHERMADIGIIAHLVGTDSGELKAECKVRPIAVATIQAGEEDTVLTLVTEVVKLISIGLDQIEAAGDDVHRLHATRLT